MGVFQFTRLPFGPCRAPSYFQEQIDSVGPKVGDPSIRGGYSKAQTKRLNWMRSQDSEIEHQVRAFSSWGNPSAPPYQSNEDRHST